MYCTCIIFLINIISIIVAIGEATPSAIVGQKTTPTANKQDVYAGKTGFTRLYTVLYSREATLCSSPTHMGQYQFMSSLH